MLPVKPWKWDAVARLLLSVAVCFFTGALLGAALPYLAIHRNANAGFILAVLGGVAMFATTLLLLRRPWAPEYPLARVVGLLVCFYAGVLICAWVGKLTGTPKPSLGQMLISLLSLQGMALFLVTLFLREQELTWAKGFGLGNRWQKAILWGCIVACLYVPIGTLLQWLSAEVVTRLPWLNLKPEAQQVVTTLQSEHIGLRTITFGVLSILVVPPAEEALFRGILYTVIKQAGFPRLALWGSSILFALVHTNLVTFVPLMLLALILIVLYEKTGNLLSPIVTHALFNAVNFWKLFMFDKDPFALSTVLAPLGLALAVYALVGWLERTTIRR